MGVHGRHARARDQRHKWLAGRQARRAVHLARRRGGRLAAASERHAGAAGRAWPLLGPLLAPAAAIGRAHRPRRRRQCHGQQAQGRHGAPPAAEPGTGCARERRRLGASRAASRRAEPALRAADQRRRARHQGRARHRRLALRRSRRREDRRRAGHVRPGRGSEAPARSRRAGDRTPRGIPRPRPGPVGMDPRPPGARRPDTIRRRLLGWLRRLHELRPPRRAGLQRRSRGRRGQARRRRHPLRLRAQARRAARIDGRAGATRRSRGRNRRLPGAGAPPARSARDLPRRVGLRHRGHAARRDRAGRARHRPRGRLRGTDALPVPLGPERVRGRRPGAPALRNRAPVAARLQSSGARVGSTRRAVAPGLLPRRRVRGARGAGADRRHPRSRPRRVPALGSDGHVRERRAEQERGAADRGLAHRVVPCLPAARAAPAVPLAGRSCAQRPRAERARRRPRAHVPPAGSRRWR